jgi:hypothetical protein
MKAVVIVGVVLLGLVVVLVAAVAVVGFQNRRLISSLTQGNATAPAPARSGGAPESSPAVVPSETPALAPRTLLDTSGSGSKISPDFTVGGTWDLAWSFDCSAMGQSRGWSVNVENGGGVPPNATLQGAIQLALKEQGTARNTAPGTFHLNVQTDPPCTWHLVVTGPPGPPPPSPSGRTLLDLAGAGPKTTPDFVAGGAWDLAWSYDCTAMGRGRNFGVSVEGTGGARGNGVIQLGEKEAGIDHNDAGGGFHLKVDADQQCTWRVVVTG